MNNKQIQLIRQEVFEIVMNTMDSLVAFANDAESLGYKSEPERYRALANTLEQFVHNERSIRNA